VLSDHPALPCRNVWVLMFDKLPSDPAVLSLLNPAENTENMQNAEQLYSPFDDLDLRSTFFEQYQVQDVRRTATTSDVLGGPECVRSFHRSVLESCGSMTQMRLACVPEASQKPDAASFFTALPLFDTTTCQTFEGTIRVQKSGDSCVFPECNVETLQHSRLVWWEIQWSASGHEPKVAAAVVDWIQDLRRQCSQDPAATAVLIVTSLQGLKRTVDLPFLTQGDESLVHAPLWIDHGGGHAFRVQTPAGSFDLLPTLLHYLTGQDPSEQPAEPSPEPGAHGLKNLSDERVSLAKIARALLPGNDRLLKLSGETWNGLRTLQYLLVRPDITDTTDGNTIERDLDEQARHLYLKPDDVWNVHDVIVAYEAIADEMERLVSSTL
jgi:hypothetical protein